MDVESGGLSFAPYGGSLHDGSVFTGPGSAYLVGSTYYGFGVYGTVNSMSNAVLAGAALTGANGVLSGWWTWTSGQFGRNSADHCYQRNAGAGGSDWHYYDLVREC